MGVFQKAKNCPQRAFDAMTIEADYGKVHASSICCTICHCLRIHVWSSGAMLSLGQVLMSHILAIGCHGCYNGSTRPRSALACYGHGRVFCWANMICCKRDICGLCSVLDRAF